MDSSLVLTSFGSDGFFHTCDTGRLEHNIAVYFRTDGQTTSLHSSQLVHAQTVVTIKTQALKPLGLFFLKPTLQREKRDSVALKLEKLKLIFLHWPLRYIPKSRQRSP